MLIDSSLSNKCWGNDILFAEKIWNRCATRKFKNKENPFERLFFKEVDLNVFKPFARTALVQIPFENRTKLYIMVERGILVGLKEGIILYKVN